MDGFPDSDECFDEEQEPVCHLSYHVGFFLEAHNTVCTRPGCKRRRKQKYTWKWRSPNDTAHGLAFIELPGAPCVGKLLSLPDDCLPKPWDLDCFLTSAFRRPERRET